MEDIDKFQDDKYLGFIEESEDDTQNDDKVIINTERKSIEQLEKEVFALVNTERTQRGLSELEWSDELADVARLHSQDMVDNDYFSHSSLNGNSFSDRMNIADISWRSAGENIAMGSITAEDVMNQWMNSDGHRKNILNSGFKKLGVGLAISPKGGYYWTQCFIG